MSLFWNFEYNKVTIMEDVDNASDFSDSNALNSHEKKCDNVEAVECKSDIEKPQLCNQKRFSLMQKFEELKKRAHDIQQHSKAKQLNTEKRRAKRLLKKALKDPHVKFCVDQKECIKMSTNENNDDNDPDNIKVEWKDVKPYLTVNSHLQGPVSHGIRGPKTELETMIDKCIAEGDFEKAEMLSDTLANKQFAVKITEAFAAKRYADELAEEKATEKAKRLKKIRWGFETKERWQMKGNM